MSRRPVLVEARPADGGIELIYSVGDQRASALAFGRTVEFPHGRCELGQTLGTPRLDEAVRVAAREDRARAEAARLWTEANRGRR